jgi:hypothetical protein
VSVYQALDLLSAGEDAAAAPDFLDFASALASASPALMLAMFIVALIKRWLILPRELDKCESRVKDVEKERDEYKQMLFRALKIGEQAVSITEEGAR